MTSVRGHYRAGRWVRPHYRRGGSAGGALALLLLALGGYLGLGHDHQHETAPRSTSAVVTQVLDGDTLWVSDGHGHDLGRVRFLGINAPEIAHPEDPGKQHAECYGNQATRVLARLTPVGTRVVLTDDPAQDDRDKYGRMLRYVSARGHDVGHQLVAAGAAQARNYESTAVVKADDYETAQRAAQAAHDGMWGSC